MWNDIVFSLWFMVPAATANVAPILSAKLPLLSKWDTPLDFGRSYKGAAIFGRHKTWRGIISGIIVATAAIALQKLYLADAGWSVPASFGVDYASSKMWLLGPLLAIGALGGDAVESFFKRRRGIPSGGSWIPFDQIDYIIGAVLLSLPIVVLPLYIYFWIFALWFAAHLIASYVGWLLKLKKDPI